jgi:hypothetical protein
MEQIKNWTFVANPEMIEKNVIDYMCSVYYFLLGPDWRSIKYWCRYTWCFPTSIPYSALGYTRQIQMDTVWVNIWFTFTFKEDLDPRILEDFNIVSLWISEWNRSVFKSVKDNETFVNSKLLDTNSLGQYINVMNLDSQPYISVETPVNSSLNLWTSNRRYVLNLWDNSFYDPFINNL